MHQQHQMSAVGAGDDRRTKDDRIYGNWQKVLTSCSPCSLLPLLCRPPGWGHPSHACRQHRPSRSVSMLCRRDEHRWSGSPLCLSHNEPCVSLGLSRRDPTSTYVQSPVSTTVLRSSTQLSSHTTKAVQASSTKRCDALAQAGYVVQAVSRCRS